MKISIMMIKVRIHIPMIIQEGKRQQKSKKDAKKLDWNFVCAANELHERKRKNTRRSKQREQKYE